MAHIAEMLAGRDVTLIDCPISGGPKGARAGTLSVIAAGPSAAMDEIRPLLQRIGKNLFEVGERPGQAQLMKLVNNLISAANMAAAFEALVLGAKGGLDAGLMVEVINASTGRNSATPSTASASRFDQAPAAITARSPATSPSRVVTARSRPPSMRNPVAPVCSSVAPSATAWRASAAT